MTYALELAVPDDFLVSPRRADFGQVVHARLRPVMDTFEHRVQERTRYATIRDAYQLTEESRPGEVRISMRNSDPNWLWREIDTSAHEIREPAHWVPIDSLIRFEEARGEPASAAWGQPLLQATHDYIVHHPGTKGDHIVEAEWDTVQPALALAFRGAVNDLFAGSFSS